MRNLVKNRHLAKSISDVSWARFLWWVAHDAQAAGVVAIAVPPRWTSQDCSGCGRRVQKSLSVRTHRCLQCGLWLDRDHNAARNILQASLAAAAPAGSAVQTLQMSQMSRMSQIESHQQISSSQNRTAG